MIITLIGILAILRSSQKPMTTMEIYHVLFGVDMPKAWERSHILGKINTKCRTLHLQGYVTHPTPDTWGAA